jgi:hypothetical protein
MKTIREHINESSLGRVFQHFNDVNKVIVILTAFRDENTNKENMKNNKIIASKLKSSGFGYFYVDGYFPENEGTELETQVNETSIFAISEIEDADKLIKLAHNLANSYNQDSIIVKCKSDIYFLDKNNNKDYLSKKGKMKIGEIGKFYTKLRNKKISNTFVFENSYTGAGLFKTWRKQQLKMKKERQK